MVRPTLCNYSEPLMRWAWRSFLEQVLHGCLLLISITINTSHNSSSNNTPSITFTTTTIITITFTTTITSSTNFPWDHWVTYQILNNWMCENHSLGPQPHIQSQNRKTSMPVHVLTQKWCRNAGPSVPRGGRRDRGSREEGQVGEGVSAP